MNYYMWGSVKDKVYKKRPKTIPELKDKIKRVMEETPESELESMCNNFEKRLRLTISKKGEHIEDILH